MVTAKHLKEANSAYCSSLMQYGLDNMTTIRADIRRREIKDAFAAQQELRNVKQEMKAKGIKRSSMMNGGHSPESMRYNETCFRLETIIKRVTPSIPDASGDIDHDTDSQ